MYFITDREIILPKIRIHEKGCLINLLTLEHSKRDLQYYFSRELQRKSRLTILLHLPATTGLDVYRWAILCNMTIWSQDSIDIFLICELFSKQLQVSFIFTHKGTQITDRNECLNVTSQLGICQSQLKKRERNSLDVTNRRGT